MTGPSVLFIENQNTVTLLKHTRWKTARCALMLHSGQLELHWNWVENTFLTWQEASSHSPIEKQLQNEPTGSSPEMIPEAAWSAYTSGRLQGDFTHRPPDGATELIGYASLCPWRQVFNHRRTDLHPLHLHLLRHDHYSDASEEAGLVSQQWWAFHVLQVKKKEKTQRMSKLGNINNYVFRFLVDQH